MFIEAAKGFILSQGKPKRRPNCYGPAGRDPPIVPVTVVGEAKVGKTSIIRSFRQQKFCQKYCPTYGVHRSQIIVHQPDDICDQKLIFRFLDTNDVLIDPELATTIQDKVDALLASFSLYVLVVYDITDHRSFEAAKDWVRLMRNHVQTDVTFVLVGNKADSPKREVHQTAGEVFALLNNMHYIETSAKTGKNLDNLLQFLITL